MELHDKPIFHAKFELDPSGHWIAELDEIPQIRTFGKTLGKARENLWSALAAWHGRHVLDIQRSVELRNAVQLPTNVQEALDLARGTREIAEAINRQLGELTAGAAVSLVDDANMSVRDAAEMLDISHQRVHQIVSAVHNQRRAEEVRRNLALVQQEIGNHQPEAFQAGQLSSNQAILAVALVAAGIALVATARSA